jgi:hypothetical protein
MIDNMMQKIDSRCFLLNGPSSRPFRVREGYSDVPINQAKVNDNLYISIPNSDCLLKPFVALAFEFIILFQKFIFSSPIVHLAFQAFYIIFKIINLS